MCVVCSVVCVCVWVCGVCVCVCVFVNKKAKSGKNWLTTVTECCQQCCVLANMYGLMCYLYFKIYILLLFPVLYEDRVPVVVRVPQFDK